MKIVLVLLIILCVRTIAQELNAETFFRNNENIERKTARGETTGSCGSLSWVFNNETSTLTISGTGKMSCCNVSYTPWSQFEDQIKTVEIQERVSILFTDRKTDLDSRKINARIGLLL